MKDYPVTKSVRSLSLHGHEGNAAVVECSIQPGIGIHIVGLADVAIKESLLRTVTALQSLGYNPGKKVIFNILPQERNGGGSHHDLALALTLIAASGQENLPDIDQWLTVGETGLDGTLRPVAGAIQAVDAMVKTGLKGCIVPRGNADEIWMNFPKDLKVYAANDIKEAVNIISNPEGYKTLFNEEDRHDLNEWPFTSDTPTFAYDFIRGNETAKRALQIAAAGGHNMLLVGPEGEPYGLFARALAEFKAPMNRKEQLETAKIYSATGRKLEQKYLGQRPVRIPHYSASIACIIGGGVNIMPGEVSLAHNGVLMMQDFGLVPKATQEALRAPLEDKYVAISRLREIIKYPANFQLVATTKPCPCGHWGEDGRCSCTEKQRELYLSKISGPIYDRLDIQVLIQTPDDKAKSTGRYVEECGWIRIAEQLQDERFKEKPYKRNAEIPSRELVEVINLSAGAKEFVFTLCERMGLSVRSVSPTLRIARTIADLAGETEVSTSHIAEAATYRFLDRKI